MIVGKRSRISLSHHLHQYLCLQPAKALVSLCIYTASTVVALLCDNFISFSQQYPTNYTVKIFKSRNCAVGFNIKPRACLGCVRMHFCRWWWSVGIGDGVHRICSILCSDLFFSNYDVPGYILF